MNQDDGDCELYDFYYTKLNFCGCGNPESQMQFLRQVLQTLANRSNENGSRENPNAWQERTRELHELLPGTLGQFYLYWIDSIGLTEHGGSIGGEWLTPYGEEILLMLQTQPYNNLDPSSKS